jgi:polyferredoxin
MKRRFASQPAKAARPWRPALRDGLALAVVCGALAMAFTRLRGVRAARITWQALLMAWALWSGGDLLSLALLSGWAEHGVPWAAASGAALIAGVALFTPWVSRRQIYCHHICPHGAAQQWLGKLRRRKPSVPPRVDRVLRIVPWLLLAAVPVLLLLKMDVARLEPFDAWIWRAAAWVPLGVAAAGLVASVFIPQAYCRYGCPTGAGLPRFAAKT